MNLINTILILIIIIFLINYFSNGQIILTLKRIFVSCKENMKSYIPIYPSNNKDSYELNDFINYIVTKNLNTDDSSSSFDERKKIPKDIEIKIVNILSRLFNINGYTFNNIKLNQDIYYYNNNKGKELEPFIFTTDIINNNNNLGNITLLIDCFLSNDNQITLKSLRIIKRNNISIIKEAAIHEKIITKMNNTFDDIYISNNDNNLFIKPTINKKQVSFQNNETDSLIPSIDEILSN